VALPADAPAASVRHRCPVCGVRHAVSRARAEVAYGRQLCCGPDCEGERRRRQRAPYRPFRGALSARR
jgi:hypothetical protein